MSSIGLIREMEHNVAIHMSLHDIAKLMPNLLSDNYFMSLIVRRDYPHHKHADKYDKDAHKKLVNMTRVSRMYSKYYIQHETLLVMIKLGLGDKYVESIINDEDESDKLMSAYEMITYMSGNDTEREKERFDMLATMVALTPYLMANYDMIGNQDNIYFINGKTCVLKCESYLVGAIFAEEVLYSYGIANYISGVYGVDGDLVLDNMVMSGEEDVYNIIRGMKYDTIDNIKRFDVPWAYKYTLVDLNSLCARVIGECHLILNK